ncbi:hypothetical protein H632_c1079p0 [Helicosporidium sp. ATCC 50920]|nr:hypothetical protein H632_c1079p0 [Helicosporidium sp. ATCC 50920]|eukprot:KDD74778.1 hypothetical protein H632_c1079p0 [Helicosporidium sp. ATCC 50920]
MPATAVLTTSIQQTPCKVYDAAPIVETGNELPAVSSGVPRTTYDVVAPAHYLGSRGVETHLVNKQGLNLKAYFWPAKKAKAVLMFVHGHVPGSPPPPIIFADTRPSTSPFPQSPGDVPRYGAWVQRLNEAGISVCGLDNQGCGRSEGARNLRFFIERFDDLVDDVLQLRALLSSAADCPCPGFANLPVFASGISMGGCVALRCALASPELFRGLMLLAPMLSLDNVSRRGLNAYMAPLAALLSQLAPSAAVVATDRAGTGSDEYLDELWAQDPLVSHMRTRVRNAHEYLLAVRGLEERLAEQRLPMLLFHSRNDSMCDCAGSERLLEQAAAQDKKLVWVDHMWHVLVKEAGNESVCDEVARWIAQRAG